MSPAQANDLIERLYDQYRDDVLRFARSRNRDLAEDVVSETFAIALRRAEVVPAGSERAWLIGVAENVMRNLQRKEHRAASLPNALRPYSATAAPAHETPVVGPAIAALPETERDVLTLTAFEGLSSAEAGERLGLSAGSTRNAMVRARRNLAIQLAAFGVLLLIPVLYLVLRERPAPVPPQARELADRLKRADQITTDATVTVGGAEPRRYRIAIDRAAGEQRVELPGGATATGRVGETARVAPAPGVSPSERRRIARANAPALRALQTITSGDLERFLLQARRADVTTRSVGTGTGHVTIVRGPFTTNDGRRVELQVVLGGEPAELRQLRVRPAGKARAPWTTVDISGWDVRLDDTAGGGAASSPRRAPGTGATAPASKPSSSTLRSAGDGSGERRRVESRNGSHSPVSNEQAKENRAKVKAVASDYAGQTGPVLHTKSVTRTFNISGGPRGQGRLPTHSERWAERGGGQRQREFTYTLTSSGKVEALTESWSGPRVWAFIPRDEDADTSTVSIVCRPRNHGRPLVGPDQAALDAGRSNLASLPIGPQIDGHETRVVRYVGETAKGRKVLGPPVTTYYLDATTGVPLRQTFAPFETEIAIQTDFSLWEEQPAGGSADQLSGTVPRRFRLQEQKACAGSAVPTSPAATTPPG